MASHAGTLRRTSKLEREIIALLPYSPWQVQVGRLRCLRGIDTLTAVGLCAEIGDFGGAAQVGSVSDGDGAGVGEAAGA